MTETILTITEAADVAKKLKADGKKLVTTNGVFDLFSVPHLRLLEAAAAEGDVLFVGINSDASVKKIKDPSRPIVGEADRAAIVAAINCVDAVFLFEEADPREWLKTIRPNVHVNSEEYGKTCVETDVLKDIGAKLVLVPRSPEASTSDYIERIRALP